MTKAELVGEVSKRTGIEKKLVLETLEAIMETTMDVLQDDDAVYLRGFGSFSVKKRAPKTARNITKQTTIQIPARKVPVFKPSKNFSVKIDKNNA
ncbi:HU family DNA-binding protein [Porphyromonadaceae bacterium W3.11]|nr:HU family DNA-binding protein [Porphyromonadaceae bacterium W3.11]